MQLSEEQIERYSRNIVLAEIGPQGQERIRQGGVLIVGAGGLGSPAALYLAAAGIGRLGIIDPERVELSNLQRQILHDTPSLGRPKVESAGKRLAALNPDTGLELIHDRLAAGNALDLVRRYDFVIDGSDNFAAKFLVNDACVIAGVPFCHAGVTGFRAQVLTRLVRPEKSACLRCILTDMPSGGETENCARSGVLGAVAGLVGSIQAAEALKVIADAGEPLAGRLLVIDALAMSFRTVKAVRDPECPVCSAKPKITALDDSLYSQP
ncbi:MAG: HesA/MoeB/ThiF family protein [Candidatus Glassbacteria bacterium]